MATITGTSGADVLIGTRQADVIDGRGGNERIILRGGDDVVRVGPNDDYTTIASAGGNARINVSAAGSAPNNYIEIDYRIAQGVKASIGPTRGTVEKVLGASTDTIIGVGSTTERVNLGFLGSSGDDVFRINRPDFLFTQIFLGAGSDLVIGIDGFTRVGWLSNVGSVDVTVSRSANGLMSGTAVDWAGDTDRFTNVNELRGTDHDDRFVGSSGADRFNVSRGDDLIDGRGGVDLMNYNRVNVVDVDVDLQRNRADHTMKWFGQDVDFRDTLRNIENIRGSNGDDKIRGDGKANELDGRGGNDVLIGRGGNDVLIANSGDNRLNGGAGADRLIAGSGNDVLIGGAGNDTFVFNGNLGSHMIRDFGRGNNLIDFSGNASVNRFADIRNDIRQVGADTVIDLGAGEIRLRNVTATELSAADFLFG